MREHDAIIPELAQRLLTGFAGHEAGLREESRPIAASLA